MQVNYFPRSHSRYYAEVVTNSTQVLEVVAEVDPTLKVSNKYMVQSPSSNCTDEVIPITPLALEVRLRFSQCNAQTQQENVEVRVANITMKRNLEGISPLVNINYFDALSNQEMMGRVAKRVC